MPTIDSVNIEFNDDNTVSYRISYKPEKKKSSNGGEQAIYLDSKTGSAETIEEVLKKIGSGKDYPKKSDSIEDDDD